MSCVFMNLNSPCCGNRKKKQFERKVYAKERARDFRELLEAKPPYLLRLVIIEVEL